MSEWLTTGEMIDRLKIGEVAESKNFKAYFDKNFQLISESKNTGVKTEFAIWSGTRGNSIWRILPKYVTFEEAMKAVKEGKKVKIHYPNGEHDFIFNKDDSVILEHTNWGELLESKFSIIK